MFSSKEWKTLKKFANENEIYQTDLNRLTLKYLSGPEAQLRDMRVAPNDIKLAFADQSLVLRECADIFIPQIFLKPHPNLNGPYSIEEISFARFTVLGYIFCAQPLQDFIYDFFAISKRNFHLQIISCLYSFNVQQISLLLTENIQPSYSLRYLHQRCNIQNDTEVSLEEVMRWALKYPLLFYPLIQFRKCFQRKFFGDKFWNKRKEKTFPSRFFEYDVKDSFDSIEQAHLTTAQAIIGDFLESTPSSLNTDPNPFPDLLRKSGDRVEIKAEAETTAETSLAPSSFIVTSEIFRRLKSEFGYRFARQLVLESQFTWSPEEQPFMNVPIPEDHREQKDERIFDPKIRATFVVNHGSGLRAWVDTYRGRDGRVLREEAFRTDPSHLNKRLGAGGIESNFSESLDGDDDSQSDSGISVSQSLASSQQRGSVRAKKRRPSHHPQVPVVGKMQLP
jgi:hypothetical protein